MRLDWRLDKRLDKRQSVSSAGPSIQCSQCGKHFQGDSNGQYKHGSSWVDPVVPMLPLSFLPVRHITRQTYKPWSTLDRHWELWILWIIAIQAHVQKPSRMDTAALFDLDRDIHFDPSQDPPLDAMSRYPIRLFWRGCELTYTLQIDKAEYCRNRF